MAEGSTNGLTGGMAICELVLETDEVVGLAEFYERQLGLEILSREEDRIWLAITEGARLGIWSPGAKEHDDRGGRHVHFALSVGELALDRLTARLREGGVSVEGPVEHDGGDRSVYFSDPAGNRVELWDFFHSAGEDEDVEELNDGESN